MLPPIFSLFCLLYCHCCIVVRASHLSQASKTFYIVEKSPEGTVVVNDLRQLLGMVNSNEGGNGGDGGGLLAISNAALPGASSFRIDQTRGSLVVATPPDRDALCPTNFRGNLDLVSVGGIGDRRDVYHGGEAANPHPSSLSQPCVVQITVVFGSPSEPSFDSLTIILDDLNDHAPKFAEEDEEHVIRVLETVGSNRYSPAPFGSKVNPTKMRIPLPEAVDLDAPENGVRHYRLEGEDAHLFYLEIGRGEDGGVAVEAESRQLIPTSEKRLWLIPSRMSGEAPSGLDYEQRKEYRFVLVAVDGGMPPRSGRLPIRLIVEDVNDHVPTFTQTQYAGSMFEDDLAGHVILHLQASDADGKYENHRINFRIPGKEASSSSLPYSEAQAAAADLFEVELVNSYDYNADSTSDHRKNATTGQLIVQRKSESQLRQAAKRGLEAAKKLQVSSIDIPHPKLRYRPLNVRSYILKFVVEAYDFGKPPLSSQVPVYVEIVDVNDEAPEIFVDYISTMPQQQTGRKGACGTLLEGHGRSMIAQVTVVDNDAASIGTEVACSLNDSRFSLEPIPTMGSGGWASMEVNAHGVKSSQAMLMYKLMSNSLVDREGVGGGTISVQISCTDNQDVDIKSKRLTSHAAVCINIVDANDNPPQFSSNVYTFKVAENLPSNRSRHFPLGQSGHFIGRVLATDRDVGPNAEIEYSLSSNSKGIVEIDSENGSLYLVSPFDREKTKQFVFTVIATDQVEGNRTAQSRLSSTAEVRILVTDMNDCQPEFESANYNFEVEENVELAEVGRVKATDADIGDFGRVRYSLAADDAPISGSPGAGARHSANALITSLFQIDPRLGIIRLRGHLDREKRVHYEFLVHAVDNVPLSGETAASHSAVRFTATATVLVMVLDQNDNPPQITSPRNLAEFMLSPDQMVAGTTIFTIEASDNDQGENATIEYELIVPESAPENSSELSETRAAKSFPFAIDQTAGVCYLKQNLPPLGADGANLYTFRVKAYDLGTPSSLNSTITVRILRGTRALSGSYPDSFLPHNRYGTDGVAKGMGGGGAYPGGEWLGDWGGETGGIPNKTLAIIVAAVFAVVILLAVLVFVYFRHQRAFSTRMIVNGVLGNPQTMKDGESYMPGNKALRLDSTNDTTPRKHIFTEVVPAPWVSSTSSTIHSPVTFAYPVVSPRLMRQRQHQPQQQQQQQQQQQLYLRNAGTGLPVASPGQCPKSGSLKSPTRFAQITPGPAFTPSAVVFRNYRITGGESTYQSTNQAMPMKKNTFQQLDCQYNGGSGSGAGGGGGGGSGGGGGGGCISSNNSSLLSKTSDLLDTSDAKDGGGLMLVGGLKKGNGDGEREISSEFSDAMPQEGSPSSYQRLMHESGVLTAASQYVIHLPDSCSPLTFENHHPIDLNKKREFCPLSSMNRSAANFVTPTHLGRPGASVKLAFRSLSIDSTLDNLSSSDYHPVIYSPDNPTRRARAMRQRVSPPPLSAPEKRLNFITNTKTLSPEIRGSFV